MFIILEELKKHINPKYQGLKDLINSTIYIVDSYGKTNKNLNLKKENIDGTFSNIETPHFKEMKNYIIQKVQNEFIIDDFDEEDGFLDFILNINFIVQKYVGYSTSNDYKNKTFKNILNYFVKFNTRGKSFDENEINKAISLL